MDEELLADFDSFSAPKENTAIVEPLSTREADPMLSDFDTFTQEEQPQIDPIEQRRPPNLDDSTWEDIKTRVGQFLTVVTAIPRSTFDTGKETIEYAQSEAGKAQSIKSRLENIDFLYSDLSDSLKSATGDKEAEANIILKKDKLNNEVVNILEERGIEAYYDKGKLLVVSKDENGEDKLEELDETVLESIMGGFLSGAGELAGGTMGAIGGATKVQRMLPPTASIPQRAIAGVVGGTIGGYGGSVAGRATDIIRNSISLNKQIDARDTLEKSLASGTALLTLSAGAGIAAKSASKIIEPLKKMGDRAKTLFKDGDINGATKQIKEDFDLTDADIDDLFENIAKDVKGLKELTGDDLQRAKLNAVVQQKPQGKAIQLDAIRQNPKAALETSKEIDFRAKEVINASQQVNAKASNIKKSVKAYEKVVHKNYGEVRSLIDEALPNYKPEIDMSSFKETLKSVNTRVIDPDVKLKVESLISSLSSQKTETVGELIDLRQLFNKFYGKNKSHFENAKDKDALFNIQKIIDSKIDEAIQSLPNNIGKQLNASFKDAKLKYVQMFKTQDTATYNAIFKKGADSEDIGKALVKYSRADDKDLETVLGKLSVVQRTKSEFSILQQLVKKATIKGEAKAIDFAELAESIGSSKSIFKSEEAKQFLKNIEGFENKFGKDMDIQKIASGVTERLEKNIATSLVGKAKMLFSTMRFEALQRLGISESGRRLSLQKSIESALEKSRTPREFFFNVTKIKTLPNKEREALKKAVKTIGEKEQQIKQELLRQESINKANIKEAQLKKAKSMKKELLNNQAISKKQWDKAKLKAKQQRINEQAQKAKDAKEPSIREKIVNELHSFDENFRKLRKEEDPKLEKFNKLMEEKERIRKKLIDFDEIEDAKKIKKPEVYLHSDNSWSGGGKGYQGYSESTNASVAKEEGKFPKTASSKILKVSSAKIEKFLPVAETHHSSKMFNEVDFYDIRPFKYMQDKNKEALDDYYLFMKEENDFNIKEIEELKKDNFSIYKKLYNIKEFAKKKIQ